MKWIYAILIFSVLVLFHEFGHFLFAKLNGVEVEEFSFGFGPRLFSTVRNGTRYSIKLLWFGGSCLMKGMYDDLDEEEEDGEEKELSLKETLEMMEQKKPEEGSFQAASVGRRAAIIFAGPFFNFLLAFVCAVIVTGTVGYDPAMITSVEKGSPAEEAGLQQGDLVTRYMGEQILVGRELSDWSVFHTLREGEPVTMTVKRDGQKRQVTFTPDLATHYRLGISYNLGDDRAYVQSVVSGSPLEAAGVKAGDVITAINGTAVASGQEMSDYFSAHPLDGTAVALTYERDGQQYETEVTPIEQTAIDPGYSYNGNNTRIRTSAGNVIRYSFYEIAYWIEYVVKSLRGMFTGLFSINDLSGPVGIVDTVGQTYESVKDEGTLMVVMNMLYLTIMLSANLGVMNLLPIPALDGGRLLFLLIEAIRRKPLSKKAEMGAQLVAVTLLMVLMVYVMYHDITRLF